ncbi:hypothetical protein [Leptospira idonii]|uniref:Phytanoyl-CoA dioxygenase n=1 Tax=Leptospira idonii TaxID=1193500 RepID=A0A4R9M4V3_9LEPT|nr:hypothetical protein [Leptospira idonii]TGN20991.1 hypothetical protein EHS15_00255 [Leptospira idonii]
MDLRKEAENLLLGKLILHKNITALSSFLSLIQSLVQSSFPEGDPRIISNQLLYEDLSLRMFSLRNRIKEGEDVAEAFFPVWREVGFDPEEIYLDAIRIRCVQNGFQEIEAAKPSAFIHRDPWYANPQCQLNFWIPVYDVMFGSGFRIYPTYFDQAIANDSNLFDYENWIKQGGFQSLRNQEEGKKIFPSSESIPEEMQPYDVYGNSGELFCFASHHLHGTSPNHSGLARFSLEVRFVLESHLEERLGPDKLDNFSKGNTLRHMYKLNGKKPVSDVLIKHYEERFVSK